MARYTKKDADGRYYIESANGKLESNIKGHTYGEAIDRFAELENADVAPGAEVAREIFNEMQSCLVMRHWHGHDILSFEFDAVKYSELKKKYTEDSDES